MVFALFQKFGIRPKGVLHVGAHLGQEVLSYFYMGVSAVAWVEAQPDLIEPLKQNVGRFKNNKVALACVTDKDDEVVKFNVTNNGMSSSVFELGTHQELHPEVVYTKCLALNSITLKSLYKREEWGINDYDLLVLDLQGAELLALKGLDELINNFKWIYTEVSKEAVYVDGAQLPDLENYLRLKGFQRDYIHMETRGWGDALYSRRDSSE